MDSAAAGVEARSVRQAPAVCRCGRMRRRARRRASAKIDAADQHHDKAEDASPIDGFAPSDSSIVRTSGGRSRALRAKSSTSRRWIGAIRTSSTMDDDQPDERTDDAGEKPAKRAAPDCDRARVVLLMRDTRRARRRR